MKRTHRELLTMNWVVYFRGAKFGRNMDWHGVKQVLSRKELNTLIRLTRIDKPFMTTDSNATIFAVEGL